MNEPLCVDSPMGSRWQRGGSRYGTGAAPAGLDPLSDQLSESSSHPLAWELMVHEADAFVNRMLLSVTSAERIRTIVMYFATHAVHDRCGTRPDLQLTDGKDVPHETQ